MTVAVNKVSLEESANDNAFSKAFCLLLAYLVVEYGRPQFLAAIRPALVIQVMLMFILLVNREQVFFFLMDRFFKLYACLLFFMGVHIFWATNNYWAFKHFQILLSYMLIGISICVILGTKRKIYSFLSFFVFILAVCAIDRISGLRIFGGSGPMGDENDFALAMNAALPISYFLGKEETGKRKWIFLACSGLLVLGCMISASRGGFLGLVVVGFGCFIYSKQKMKTAMAILLIAALAWGGASAEFKQEILGIGLGSAESDTGKARIEIWKITWRAFIDHPIFGVGQGNMPIVMEEYQYDEHGKSFWGHGLWGKAVHSVYLTILSELGIVGALLFVFMLREIFRKYRLIEEIKDSLKGSGDLVSFEVMNRAIKISIVGYLVSGAFLSAFYYPQLWNLAALLIALRHVHSQEVERKL